MQTRAGDRYIVISADGHAGAQMHEYRPYLEERYRSDFDEWAKSFVNPWTDLRGETAYRNWDSTLRLRELEARPDLRARASTRRARGELADQAIHLFGGVVVNEADPHGVAVVAEAAVEVQ